MGKKRKFEKDFYFDCQFFKHLWRIVKFLLFPKFNWAVSLILSTLIIAVGSEVVGYFTGLVPGKMYRALLNKDKDEFWNIMLRGTLLYIGKTLLIALTGYSSWFLYLWWRRNCVYQLHKRYFRNKAYYNINCIDDYGVDNPDQRITQDVERMTNKLAINIVPNLIIGPFVIAYYTYKTASTAGALGIALIYGYFVIGVIVNKLLVSPMVKWNARTEKAEGDFRYKHVTVRNNAESSALHNAEDFEFEECNRIFLTLWWRQVRFISWKLPNLFWQQFFDYYGGILSYAIQYIPIFMLHIYDDKPPSDIAMAISNNAFVYIYLVNSFTRITDLSLSLGEMAGIIEPVSFSIDQNSADLLIKNNLETETPYSDTIMEIKNLSYSIPTNSDITLLQGELSFTNLDENILVVGPSGCGKSSLIRVISRLWKQDSGIVVQNTKYRIMRLPQTPYFPTGYLTLLQQIQFPYIEKNDLSSKGIFSFIYFILILQDTLTPGEQQRLAFARILYRLPHMVMLDESTSSVSIDLEKKMYELLKKVNYYMVIE
ncbi:unnamed protein product [Dracunculus medinensis]|uniref:ABC transmembrane type-1 domain-containing protein n=1 Tax=Dracunculus medinensis TaxID=318479 RepID=A0A0N4UDG0_DRAME|nr:unnamed protein product [Dracunculus medinensis]